MKIGDFFYKLFGSLKYYLYLCTVNLKRIIMSMKFETEDRPDRSLQIMLSEDNTPLSKIPFPRNTEEPYFNFQEILASERYVDIVENFRKYAKTNMVMNGPNISPMMMAMMGDVQGIIELEYNHHEELENLAIELVTKEMGIPEGSFNFDVKIEVEERISGDDFKHNEENNNNESEVDIDEEDIPLNNDDDMEISKRRLINTLIHGASKRGHFMFHIVEDKLKEIIGNNKIIDLYGRMMSINDAMYWQLSDEQINMLGGGGGGDASVAGKEQIDRNTTPPTIYVRAINFPVLVHEIIKGIMEVFAVHGLPENYDNFAEEEETIEKESWDLRLGPSIWKRLRSQFPMEIIMDEDKVELQNYLLVEIFKLPARDFLYFMREIMEGSDEGKRLMNRLYQNVLHQDDEEYEDTDE